MKILTKITIGLATSALLFVGCSNAPAKTNAKANASVVKPTITEANLGYRGTDDLLKEDVIPPAVAYHQLHRVHRKNLSVHIKMLHR